MGVPVFYGTAEGKKKRDMITAKGLDWIRVSFREFKDAEKALWDIGGILQDTEKELSPLPYYTHVRAYNVCRLDWNVLRPTQKVLVTFTGADLRRFEMQGGECLDILHHCALVPGVKFTRIDFAVDIFEAGIEIQDVSRAIEDKRALTHFRTHGIVLTKTGKETTGETLYLGSRQSGNMIRIYDKQLQAGVESTPWVRIELECKDDFAHRLAHTLLEYGVAEGGSACIRRLIQADVKWFDDAVQGQTDVRIESVGRKETAREKWVATFLIPQTLKAIHDDTANIRAILRDALRRIEAD